MKDRQSMAANKPSYGDTLNYLYGLQKFGIKFGLSKTSNILARFKSPHLGRNYIHIAGTNGKGSVAAFLCTMLREAGFKVGLYSSPHLVRFTERFQINGSEIEREEVVSLTEDIKGGLAPGDPPTFFEFTTAMALLYFARHRTEIDIMEVGMGGRLDATNVITPLVSVITNISREHTFYLGKRLADIAMEKAGIVKEGVPVITGAHQPGVVQIIESICRQRHAGLVRVGADVKYRFRKNGFDYYGRKNRYSSLALGLNGGFQPRNAATALAALETLESAGFVVKEEKVRLGLENTRWPGRMHVLSRNPTVILDGAHNPGAMAELAASIRNSPPGRKLFIVVGILEDKDIKRMIRAIVPLADFVWYSRPAYGRAAPADLLAAAAYGLGKPRVVQPELNRALDEALAAADPEDAVLVCGSLYTVGEALTHLDPEKWPPEAM
jgi:dihydrofolate synthase / folylpolyglutamate synthase